MRTEIIETVDNLKNTAEELKTMIAECETKISMLQMNLRDCRNELCLKCGNYKNAHNGACNGCRWLDEWRGVLK